MDTTAMKGLHLPPNKKTTGLTVYCYKCNADVTECKTTSKPLPKCPFGERHVFKVYAHVPGTKNKRLTKKLDTRDANEAIKQAIAFEQDVKRLGEAPGMEGNSVAHMPTPNETSQQRTVNTDDRSNTPLTLTHALARYVGYLHGEGVPAHRKRPRSAEYLRDIEGGLRLLVTTLKERGYDLDAFTAEQINDEVVGHIYEALTAGKHYSTYTDNRFLGYYSAFMRWYADQRGVPVKNWFDGVTRKKINPSPQSISRSEYQALLASITPENGVKEYKGGEKPVRNLYRPWLKDGIRLGLETGRRREEVCTLRFDQIVEDERGPMFIRVEDYKVNRIQNRTDDDKKYIFIPVTDSLHNLLLELGLEQHRGTDKYILAPDAKIDRRDVMPDSLSRGFSHYYEQLSTGKKLTYKSLRKTYITNLSVYLGGNAKAITRHSDDAVVERHYLDKAVVAKAAQGFSVFGETTERDNELDRIRTKASEQRNIGRTK